jgi:hypothetical protein
LARNTLFVENTTAIIRRTLRYTALSLWVMLPSTSDSPPYAWLVEHLSQLDDPINFLNM